MDMPTIKEVSAVYMFFVSRILLEENYILFLLCVVSLHFRLSRCIGQTSLTRKNMQRIVPITLPIGQWNITPND